MAQGKEARNKRRREHYQEHKDKFDKTAINKKRRERRLKNGNADNKAYYKKHRAKLLERAKAYAQTPHGRYLDYKNIHQLSLDPVRSQYRWYSPHQQYHQIH